jgi:hypothetical protein
MRYEASLGDTLWQKCISHRHLPPPMMVFLDQFLSWSTVGEEASPWIPMMRYEEVMTAFFLGEAEATTAPPAVQNHFQGRRHQLVAEARDGQVSLRSWAAWVPCGSRSCVRHQPSRCREFSQLMSIAKIYIAPRQEK